MTNGFHIAIAYQEPFISKGVVDGFEEDVRTPGLKVLVEPVPMMGMRAAVEWLISTAIVAYFAKPYFESFLGEMGKDHYAIIKKALTNLRTRIVTEHGESLDIFSSKGKNGKTSHRYSPIFSIEAETLHGYRVKLLIQTEIDQEHFNLAVEAFLRLLCESYGMAELSLRSAALLNNKPTCSVLLVCYNVESRELEYINPIPRS